MSTPFNYSLVQLEYALAVHRYGHFAKAAEHCGVSQPTLSMQLQKLEETLGVVIFDRSKKPILLTGVGEKIIDQMKRVVGEAQKIQQMALTNENDKASGQLRLGVIPTLAPFVLPRLLAKMKQDLPDLELKIFELQTSDIIEKLDHDEIDAGLLATPLRIDRFFEHALFYEPFSVYCRKDHPYSLQKKIKHSSLNFDDIWLLEEGHCLRNQVIDVCSVKKPKSTKRAFEFESGNLETIKNLVESMGGYSLLPEMAAINLPAKTMTIPFERPIPAREVGFVYRREHFKVGLIEALAQSLIQSLPVEIRKIRQKDLEVLPVETGT